ncbi:MAG: ribonuclease Y [Candidatus Pacebacteria bacterium]|nr:ribonuclease Y [Candidatus Paceibacterota bacterium]
MSLLIVLIIAIAAGLTGIALGWFLRFIISLGKRGSMELEIKEMMLSAREEVEKIRNEAEEEASEILKQSKIEIHEFEEKVEKTETRLINKENYLDKRQTDLDESAEEIKHKQTQIEETEIRLKNLEKEKVDFLEKISEISKEEAKKELIESLEKENAEDIMIRLQKMDISGKEKLELKARDIITTAIHRLGNSVSSDIFSSNVTLPSDEIKGKIIGKEGRNIKSFERATGVELIIDDTPATISISSFDPVRREIAKIALEQLVLDGRIQPAKIEECVEKAKKSINKTIVEKGEQAAYECGIFNLDPRIISILGRLHFRTSYGHNVLRHSIEMSHISGMIAEEIGADVRVAKAGALLHDIGKAVDHEVPGTHVEIGRRILQKFGADEAVIKAMQAHHEEYAYETPESIIVQVADAISGSRPGARRDNTENYLKRLNDLEAIANEFKGVEKSYALQAGREIRIFVNPEEISDLEAHNLARNIALKIEKDLKYPGEIKVTVIRENRVIEVAR